jgi:RNA polymerase sigma-70 factor (ECF subfamily)
MGNGIPQAAACESTSMELEAWIEAAQGGDREALGNALASVRDYLLLVAGDRQRPELRGKGDPSDLVQETFLRAQRGIEGFRGCTASEWRNGLRSILVRTLAKERRRFLATAKRRLGREVAIPDAWRDASPGDDETPSRVLARRERAAALLEILDSLPEHYRDVVIHHHREQLTFAEIGRRSGKSEEAARKLWTRALGRLRKELGPDHDP